MRGVVGSASCPSPLIALVSPFEWNHAERTRPHWDTPWHRTLSSHPIPSRHPESLPHRRLRWFLRCNRTHNRAKIVLAVRSGIMIAPCYAVEGFSAAPTEGSAKSIIEQPYQRLSLGSACTVGSTSWMPLGGNVRFRIPSAQLSYGRRIGIAFEYEWENAKNLEHRVYFARAQE